MIRVGNAQAFWGDRPSAARELLEQVPELDFLTMDYLAEVSMSILALQRQRDSSLGYPRDFVEVVRGLAPYWANGGRCRLIANAGGLNPTGCARACVSALEQAGCRSMKIGVVSGDDVLPLVQTLGPSHEMFRNLDSQLALTCVSDRLVTANAYLGCRAIAQSLDAGAGIVITGRVADPSLVVAACVHAFGWDLSDWDRLAGATVAGHLLECGTQVTGGISSDWLDVPDAVHLGFPIAEIDREGNCTITKSACSGGLVTEETVKEQLVYEIGDPDRYQSPDVTVSFLGIDINPSGLNRVLVRGAKGRARSNRLKVSATYRDGYRAAGSLTVFGFQAVRKARRCGEIILQRLSEAGNVYRDTLVECLGNAESVPVLGQVTGSSELFETVMRIAVESDSKAAVEQFSRELMQLVTGGPQGTTGYAEGRPSVHEVFRYWPCLIETDLVVPIVDHMISQDTQGFQGPPPAWPRTCQSQSPVKTSSSQPDLKVQLKNAKRLADVAYGRSGDKGTSANIGILVRSRENYQWLRLWLTSQRVQEYLAPIGVESVQRYELPNLQGLNFVVQGVLRRGLRNDAQGKALAQALLAIPLNDSFV